LPPDPDKRIVFGPFQPDLEDRLVEEVVELRRRDRLASAILLVGSNPLGAYLTRLLARRTGGHCGLRVMTFLDVARSVAAPAIAREGLRPLPDTGERLLVRNLAASVPRGSYFHGIRDKAGFEEALLATLRDLRDGGFAARDLTAVFGAGRGKMADLAALLEGYERRLAESLFIDRAGVMARAIACLEGSTGGARGTEEAGTRLLGSSARLLVYGFYDFTWAQERLLALLLERMPATAFFPWSDGPGHEYAREARDRLLVLGFRAGGGPGPAEGSAPPGDALRRVQRRLFETPEAGGEAVQDGAATDDPSLSILAAPGEAREALEAVRAVVGLARQGVPFEEMAILYRGGEEYPGLIAPILRDLGIPAFRTDGAPLRPAREARAALLLLDIKDSDFERGRVIDFLTLADADDTTDANPADWDLLSRLAGITSGRKPWGDRLERLAAWLARRGREARDEDDPEAEPPPDPRLVEEARRLPPLFARLAKGIEQIPSEGTWSRIAAAISRVLERFLGPTEGRREVLEILEGLGALDDLSPATDLREFRRLLEFAIDRRARAEGHFQRGHLLLADVLTARGLGFRAVVLTGMVEQSFPVGVRQDPILLDEERAALNARGGRLPIKARRALEDRLLFALTVASAGGRLVLTFPRIDADTARERLPSSYLLRVVEAETGRPCDYEGLQHHPALRTLRISQIVPADRRDALREREFDLSAVEEGVRSGDPRRAILPAGLPGGARFFRRGLLFEHLRRGPGLFTPMDGRLGSTEALRILRDRHGLGDKPLSPTRLQQYMTCPYQYFCERVLGLEPSEAPEEVERLSALDRGSLMHAVLHEFFSRLRERGGPPLRRREAPGLKELLLAIIRRRFGEVEQEGLAGPPLLAAIERETIEADLLRVLEEEIDLTEEEGPRGFRPAHFEVRFGMPADPARAGGVPEDPLSTGTPVPLDLGSGASILFKGQIDRIDLTADGGRARVIDYKSGSLESYEDDSHGAGTALQLPVYILAAEMLLPGSRVGEALYRSIARRGRFGRVVFGRNGWERTLEDLRQVGRVVREGVGAGAFFHFPDEKAQCKHCDQKPICGEARTERFERKRSDPIARPFLEFKDGHGGGS
jgi:hypothetical protein